MNRSIGVLNLSDNLDEVKRLVEIHEQIGGGGPGRKHAVQVLNKSAIVLLAACWEACVEDLISEALKFIIDKAKSHEAMPKSVLESVASKHQGPKAWDLAGHGWKKALRDNLKEVLGRTTGNLNTPRAEQVDALAYKVLGLHKLSGSWRWAGAATSRNIKRLDEWITLRGSIAHRVATSKKVQKNAVSNGWDLVCRLVTKSNNRIGRHVYELVNRQPWAEESYGEMT